MIFEVWFGADTFQEVLYRAREFCVDNGISDVRQFAVQMREEPREGWVGVMHYTKEPA